MKFFMHMIPPTSTGQMHKVRVVGGKPVFYDPPEVVEAKQKLMSALYRRKPEKPYKGAIRLTVKWCFPITNSKYHDGEYRTTKPDTDNLQKILKDCMTKLGYWEDDCQVASEIIEKFWADVPGIFIRIEEL